MASPLLLYGRPGSRLAPEHHILDQARGVEEGAGGAQEVQEILRDGVRAVFPLAVEALPGNEPDSRLAGYRISGELIGRAAASYANAIFLTVSSVIETRRE